MPGGQKLGELMNGLLGPRILKLYAVDTKNKCKILQVFPVRQGERTPLGILDKKRVFSFLTRKMACFFFR